MGFMDKIVGTGGQSTTTTDDYVELDLDDISTESAEARMQVRIAEISGQADAVAIKDAVYDGDVVFADITRLRTNDSTVEHIVDELRQVAHEVDGDIVRKGDDQIIVTPAGVRINRTKLGQDS
ncbi:cell division protein SepF [Natronococcus sp. A-GB7]|uniref:cell division protein SepF n=1 Tax=Natronococcus sp. A-GB7 TaxID=3037649 RepID=UPI00241E6880|nr:cell division protein SepF [Natronococcus sp. A-GB7]MDG5819091.1 cell division protein SepF [Natronococcus sp. A-GB7]